MAIAGLERSPLGDAPGCTAYAISFWVDSSRDWLRKQAVPDDVTGRTLIAAAIVHGIPYTRPPYSSLGLTLGEHIEARKTGWNQVLASGQCPDPVRD